jgi:hypothetical protein
LGLAADIKADVDAYIATLPPGTEPDRDVLFQKLYDRVETGGAVIPQWDNTREYDSGDVIYYNALIWVSLQNSNTGNTPSFGSAWWRQEIIPASTQIQNTIINGGMNIWQRGTSFAAVTPGTYSADRWRYGKAGAVVHTISRDTTVPNSNTNYSIKLDVTTADASLAAGDYCYINHRVEGYNFLKYVGKSATLQFWVRDSKTGTHAVSFVNSGADRSYVAEYEIQAADTWEWKQIQIDFDYSGGTWDYTNGLGLRIGFTLAVGSTFQTTAGAWQNGNYLGTANTVNSVDNTSNNFYLSNVKFELGSIATNYHEVDIAKEVERCERYYQKTYNLNTTPGTITVVGSITFKTCQTSTLLYEVQRIFPVRMRNTPLQTWYSPSTGNSGNIRNVGTGADVGVSSDANESEISCGVIVASASVADQSRLIAHLVRNAEL